MGVRFDTECFNVDHHTFITVHKMREQVNPAPHPVRLTPPLLWIQTDLLYSPGLASML